jgi:hypothetical protein
MKAVKYMKDPSVKVNKNWGHNKPMISQKSGEYAYLSPLIREVCMQCKDLNVQLMNMLKDVADTQTLKNLAKLNNYRPDILQKVIYEKDIYTILINRLPALCEHDNTNGSCNVEDCAFNPSSND